MRSLYSILESITDDDDVKLNKGMEDAVIETLIEHGIYYAHGEYDGSGRFKGEYARFIDNELYFYDREGGWGSTVYVDCNKASKYLGAIKAIHAPIVYFLDAGAANVDLPKVYGLRATIKDAPKSLDNFKFQYECIVDKFVDIMGPSPSEKSFKTVAYSTTTTLGTYIQSYHNYLHLVNCEFTGGAKSKDCILNIHCDDLKLSGVKSDFARINMYDPSLFGPGYDMSLKLNKLFDHEHEFDMTGDMGKVNAIRVTRKTKTFDSIVAYFNNKKYRDPSDSPFRVDGKLRDVFDITGFTDPKFSFQLRNNNVLVEFTKDVKRAEYIQKSDKRHYAIEGKEPAYLEKTFDRFYVVFAKHG